MAKDIKDKSITDLSKLLVDKKTELQSLRIGSAGSKSKNVKAISTLKKDVARILTELNLRKIA